MPASERDVKIAYNEPRPPLTRCRLAPYLWSASGICRLLEEARAPRPPLRAATHETLFGLFGRQPLSTFAPRRQLA